MLFGPNGAGKTNVLEAIYLVATLRSFRSAELGPLIQHEAPGGRVDLVGHDPVADLPTKLSVKLTRSGRGARRTAEADGKFVRSAKDFYGRVAAILFTPEDLAVLRGSPTSRRQFLDRALFARTREHISDVAAYEKVVRSRNQVLKEGPPEVLGSSALALLETYETQIAAFGARIWGRRDALLRELAPGFERFFAAIHDADFGVSLRYVPKLEHVPVSEAEDGLRRALQASRTQDHYRSGTGVGPHRDDIEFLMDGRPAAKVASQGQARAMVLGFKMAELASAREATGYAPLLLLDDVSSELDPKRSEQLYAALTEHAGQCLLTTTGQEFARLPGHVAQRSYRVASGVLEPVADPA